MPAINITTTQAADPITAGYKAVWSILRANALFMANIKRTNDWSDGTLEALALQALTNSDMPEISLLQGAFVLKPWGSNSKAAEIDQVYTLVDVTGTLQVSKVNQIKWAVMGAFRANSPESVTWDSQPFCRGFMLASGSDGSGGISLPGLGGDSPARGVSRLVSIVAITLSLYVSPSLLPA